MYVGPSRTPMASAAARATETAASTTAAGSSLGQTWASATPNAGGSATTRSVTVSGWNAPSTENALTVSSRPATSFSTSTTGPRAASSATANASATSSGRVHDRQAALPLAVGRLDHARKAELGRGLDRLVDGRADAEGRVRDARLGQALALLELRDRELGHLRLERMGKVVSRGDACRDRDREVDPRSDDAADLLRRGQPVDRRLVLDRHDRPPVRMAEPGRRRITVDGDDVEAALGSRFEQPELPGARP